MKEFDFREVFCELLSGAIGIGVILLYVELLNIHRLDGLLNCAFDFPILTAFFVASYLLGLIIDAIGLSIGSWFLDKVLATESKPTDTEHTTFWTSAKDEKIKYRETQWVYYSLYRNLIILSSLSIIAVAIIFMGEFNLKKIAAVVSLILLDFFFFKSARVLINLCYKLTK